MQTIVFLCGPPKDHKCDSDGPTLCGGENPDGTFWEGPDSDPDNRKRAFWGSVSCSICGVAAIHNAVWSDF